MDILQPTLLSNIIDVGVANGDKSYIIKTGAIMITAAISGLVGGMLCSIFASIAATKLAQELRKDLFKKIQGLSFLEIDRFKTSSLITRLTNDVNQIQNMVMMSLKVAIRAPLTAIGGIVMGTLLSPKLAVVFLVIIPIILCLVVFILYKSFPLFRLMQEKIDKVNLVIRENILGISVTKAFNLENKQLERFDDANYDLMDKSIKAQNITIILMPIVTLIVNLSIVIVLWYGGNLVDLGVLESGKIIAFINYLIQIMSSLMIVVTLVINFSRANASADRVNAVLETNSSIVEVDNSVEISNFDVEFKNVSFKYHKNSEDVLSNISFKVEEGEKIGIIGGTGSGKSSLVALIPRLYDVSSGEILIGGVNVKNIKLSSLRDKIGIVLQENILFSGSIRDNLEFAKRDVNDEEMNKAAKTAQAYEFISSKEGMYDYVLEQRGKNLSGGQKQRLSITRTILKNPKILILDDSSSALDMSTERRLQDAIKNDMNGCTTFMIAQRISGIMDADKIIVLDDGKISGIGTHKELISSNEIYRSIAVTQLGEEVVNSECR